jgi:O-acetyl-ADP-ribose deacetylase (regulator of RNase III)
LEINDEKQKEIFDTLVSGEADNVLLLPVEYNGIKTGCIFGFGEGKDGSMIIWPVALMVNTEIASKIVVPKELGELREQPVEFVDEDLQREYENIDSEYDDWKLKEVDGDLIDLAMKGEFDVIIHGANCHHIMGAGIAGQIAKVFPEAYEADKKTELGPSKLGDYSLARIVDKEQDLDITIINAYTQNLPGRNLDYGALEEALNKIDNIYNEEVGKVRIGIPEIGCGIAGGEWEEVKKIIENAFVGHDITVVHFKPVDNDPLNSIEPLKK